MGYRSDVYVGLAVEDFCILRNTVGKNPGGAYIIDEWVKGWSSDKFDLEDCKEVLAQWDEYYVTDWNGEDFVWFHISGIKWYDSYEPIQTFVQTIENFEKPWGMWVIGEEIDDVSSYGDPWELEMILNRYVETPGSYSHVQKPAEIQTDSVPPECGFPLNWVRIGSK